MTLKKSITLEISTIWLCMNTCQPDKSLFARFYYCHKLHTPVHNSKLVRIVYPVIHGISLIVLVIFTPFNPHHGWCFFTSISVG